jgi:hypothetical protein
VDNELPFASLMVALRMSFGAAIRHAVYERFDDAPGVCLER